VTKPLIINVAAKKNEIWERKFDNQHSEKRKASTIVHEKYHVPWIIRAVVFKLSVLSKVHKDYSQFTYWESVKFEITTETGEW